MLFARLEINQFGYIVADYMGAAQYEGDAYSNGKLKFAEAYVRGEIAVKKVQLIERLKLFHGNGHQRAPISVLVYSTKPVIEALLDPFVVQIASEEMLTPNPRIVGWLKVGWHMDKLTPMFIVREGIDLTKVDTFFKQAVDFSEETMTIISSAVQVKQFAQLIENNQKELAPNKDSDFYTKSPKPTTVYPGRMMHIDNSAGALTSFNETVNELTGEDISGKPIFLALRRGSFRDESHDHSRNVETSSQHTGTSYSNR